MERTLSSLRLVGLAGSRLHAPNFMGGGTPVHAAAFPAPPEVSIAVYGSGPNLVLGKAELIRRMVPHHACRAGGGVERLEAVQGSEPENSIRTACNRIVHIDPERRRVGCGPPPGQGAGNGIEEVQGAFICREPQLAGAVLCNTPYPRHRNLRVRMVLHVVFGR